MPSTSTSEELPESTLVASNETHYEVLQISPAATQEEIKIAYRSLVVGCHPDKLPPIRKNESNHNHAYEETQISVGMSAIDIDDEDDESENDNNKPGTDKSASITIDSAQPTAVPNAEEKETTSIQQTKFHQIQAAYHCLRDTDKRRQYDESISRKEERLGWKLRGALQVNLSEMECDWCCVVDEENSDDDDGADQSISGDDGSDAGTSPLQKVFFHPCRCGDTFQVFQEELLESVSNANICSLDKIDVLTHRVWQCESCSLTIQIHVDIDID
mmetsp:Transcript_16062/g.29042  ORF Transcript_16062/g.29042 Transcript_16062/m.29042 type:complete len:273 (-) Transcript_16062:90-908(-)